MQRDAVEGVGLGFVGDQRGLLYGGRVGQGLVRNRRVCGRRRKVWKGIRSKRFSMALGDRLNPSTAETGVRKLVESTGNIVGEVAQRALDLVRKILSAFEFSATLVSTLMNEFEKLRRTQPIDPASAARPDLFPDGIKLIILGFIATYLSLRFFQFLVNLLRFSAGVLVSTVQTITSETPFLRLFLPFLGAPTTEAFIFDGDSDSLFQKSGDFRARELTDQESAEWVNAAVRKIWRLYPEELSRVATEIMQESINENLVDNRPPFVDTITVESVEPGDRPFWIRDVEKLPTKIDSHLAYHFTFRYYGDAKVILRVSLHGPFQRLWVNVPVLVSDIDIESKSWVRAKFTPQDPFIYEIAGAFVEHPKLDIVIKPFKAVNLMTIPGLSRYLRGFLINEVPKQWTLPRKIIMYLDPDIADVPSFRTELDNQNDDYKGVLAVTLFEAKEVGGMPVGLSNPFCYLKLNDKVIKSKKDNNTSRQGGETTPVWNQQFELLVKDPWTDVLEVEVHNRFGVMSRPVGSFQMRLDTLADGRKADIWVPLRGGVAETARLHLGLSYREFVDDEDDDEFYRIRDQALRRLRRKRANLRGKQGTADEADTVEAGGAVEEPAPVINGEERRESSIVGDALDAISEPEELERSLNWSEKRDLELLRKTFEELFGTLGRTADLRKSKDGAEADESFWSWDSKPAETSSGESSDDAARNREKSKAAQSSKQSSGKPEILKRTEDVISGTVSGVQSAWGSIVSGVTSIRLPGRKRPTETPEQTTAAEDEAPLTSTAESAVEKPAKEFAPELSGEGLAPKGSEWVDAPDVADHLNPSNFEEFPTAESELYMPPNSGETRHESIGEPDAVAPTDGHMESVETAERSNAERRASTKTNGVHRTDGEAHEDANERDKVQPSGINGGPVAQDMGSTNAEDDHTGSTAESNGTHGKNDASTLQGSGYAIGALEDDRRSSPATSARGGLFSTAQSMVDQGYVPEISKKIFNPELLSSVVNDMITRKANRQAMEDAADASTMGKSLQNAGNGVDKKGSSNAKKGTSESGGLASVGPAAVKIGQSILATAQKTIWKDRKPQKPGVDASEDRKPQKASVDASDIAAVQDVLNEAAKISKQSIENGAHKEEAELKVAADDERNKLEKRSVENENGEHKEEAELKVAADDERNKLEKRSVENREHKEEAELRVAADDEISKRSIENGEHNEEAELRVAADDENSKLSIENGEHKEETELRVAADDERKKLEK